MAELSNSNKSDNDKSDQETQCLVANNVNDNKSDNLNNDKSGSINNDKSININNDESDNINDDTTNNTTSNNKNDCNLRESTRRQFYKSRIRKDNIKLELDDSTSQEERRRLLLEHQKKLRDETINTIRGIQECSTSKNEDIDKEKYIDEEQHIDKEEYIDEEQHIDKEEYIDEEQHIDKEEYIDEEQHIDKEEYIDEIEYMDAEEYMNEEEYMEVEDYASSYYKILPNDSRTSRMMLSEWMLDVPQDLIENWIMVPCPIGKRVRMISGWGETRSYSRKGVLHGVFPSALPGGNPDSDFHHSAAVDCLWIKNRKLFYILDVLYWSQLPFTNCQAEFRFFWITTKFQEIPEFKERNADTNKYPILTLPNINCNSDINSALANLDNKQSLDGLLFYHRQALYTYGLTPLVTWLKPFMLSEVLGISIPSFDEKPDNYISFEDHVQKVKAKKNRQDNTTKSDTDFMEIEGVV
ncbi:Snurportin-1 [Trachymyrmex septentrionalis]|uniref:Snurportin-1 n=1 Tax=Trachymyrmex septentrionalis TaxID=34720 RepID=A0A195EY99_9HYME|nr:PREDICTED: snurportin-1 [Trachymyrmex septentrionalis]XP_018351070.1 PREDICTED: snurportin-1 [Trachymyrmex septentrionalis]KYN33260.1 Snurportin-1 [Trachymyrmex septentrionalis]